MLILYRIRWGCNYMAVFKTGAKSSQGESSPWVEQVSNYNGYFIEKGNINLGRNITCAGILILLTGFNSKVNYFMFRDNKDHLILLEVKKLRENISK